MPPCVENTVALYAFSLVVQPELIDKVAAFFCGLPEDNLGSIIKRYQEVCYFDMERNILSFLQRLQRTRT